MSDQKRVQHDLRSCTFSTPSILDPQDEMSHSLNSLKGDYIGDYIGDYYRGF